jgi:uncharacterized protein with GYD domain
MPTYVMLLNWTDQGIRNVSEGPKRMETAKAMLKDMGGEAKSVYLTMGQYDMVVTYDAPDDAVAARFTLMLGKTGNVRSVSMKAFPEQAYHQIVASLG